jgi:hypothetical protein
MKVIILLLEHFANAAATAGESSAVPFEDWYLDGMTQTLLRAGENSRVAVERDRRPKNIRLYESITLSFCSQIARIAAHDQVLFQLSGMRVVQSLVITTSGVPF